MITGRFRLPLLIASVSAALSSTPTVAQSICQEILAQGAFRRLAQQERSYSSLVYASRLERMSHQEAMREFEASGGITLKGIPFRAGMSQEEYRSSIEQLRQSVDLTDVRAHEAQLVVADGDPEIVRAWQSCVAGLTGMTARMRPVDDQLVELIIEYRPPPGGTQSPVVDNSSGVRNAQIVAGGEYFEPNNSRIGVANPRVITLRRTSPNAAVYASVNTDRGSATAWLPPRPQPAPPRIPQPIVIRAVDYAKDARSWGIAITTQPGNPNWVWGEGIANGGPPWDASRQNRASFDVHVPQAGIYSLAIEYASGEPRPIDIVVNNSLWKVGALTKSTGGFCANVTADSRCPRSHATWETVGPMQLRQGINNITLHRGAVFPHIKTLRLTFVGQ